MSEFAESLAFGAIGESEIAEWLKSRGNSVMPVYEKEIPEGKGPQFFTPNQTLVAPDLFIFPTCVWIEAKHKTVFSWYRKKKRWVTGIDLNHYADYLKVQATSKRPVFLMFLHKCSIPDKKDISWGCPRECPTGLFSGNLKDLREMESHRHENHGRYGMVYWAHGVLKKLATIEELQLSNST